MSALLRGARRVATLLVVAAAPLLANEPEASGHGSSFLGLPMVAWQAVNLVAFLALLVWFARKPAAAFFGGRRAEVAEALRKADEQRRRAESLEAQLKGRLTELEKELVDLKARAAADTAAEREALTRETELEVSRVVARARGEMDARVREARAELTAHAGDLAVEIAKGILAKEVNASDQERLVSDGIRQLADAGKAS